MLMVNRRSQFDFGWRCMFPNWSHWDVEYTRKGVVWKWLRKGSWYASTIGLLAVIVYGSLRRGGIRQFLGEMSMRGRLAMGYALAGAANRLQHVRN